MQQTAHRARTIQPVIALVGQPAARILIKLDVHILLCQLQLKLQDKLVDHTGNGAFAEIGKWHNRIEAVAEFRGEHLFHRFFTRVFLRHVAKADSLCRHHRCAGIGGHDQHDIAEIDCLAVVVGQTTIIHHLQQDVEQVRVRLFDFVQEQHAMRVLVDRIGQQAALVIADIARRGTDQARHTVALHIFGHVEPLELNPHDRSKLSCDFGFADAGRAREQE